MKSFINLIPDVIKTFAEVFFLFNTPIGTLLEQSDNSFLNFFYDLAEVFGLTNFFSDISLLTLCLGTGLIVVILVNVIKWATP